VFADEAEKHHRTDRVPESSQPFDLKSQLKELKADAVDQRKNRSISIKSRDPSEGGRRRVLNIKKLGTAASREASQSK